MGYFCKTIYCWELSIIAQSGHTGWRDFVYLNEGDRGRIGGRAWTENVKGWKKIRTKKRQRGEIEKIDRGQMYQTEKAWMRKMERKCKESNGYQGKQYLEWMRVDNKLKRNCVRETAWPELWQNFATLEKSLAIFLKLI